MTKITPATSQSYNLSTKTDSRFSNKNRVVINSQDQDLSHLFPVAMKAKPSFLTRFKWIKVKKGDEVFYINMMSLRKEWGISFKKVLAAKVKSKGFEKLVQATLKDAKTDSIKNRILSCANKSHLTKQQLKKLTAYVQSVSAEKQEELRNAKEKAIKEGLEPPTFIRVRSSEVKKITGVKRTITFYDDGNVYIQSYKKRLLGDGTSKKAKYVWEVFGTPTVFLVAKHTKSKSNPRTDDEIRARQVKEANFMVQLSKNSRSVKAHDIRYYTSSKGEPKQVIRMDVYANGDLQQYMEKNKLSREEKLKLMSQMAESLIELKNDGVIHKDIKLENFMIDAEGNLFVGDYGFAGTKDDRTYVGAGTQGYYAPEALDKDRDITERQDWWSMGVVMHKLYVNGGPEWLTDISKQKEYRDNVTSKTYAPEYVDPKDPIEQLIWRLLSQDPSKRPTPEEAKAIIDAHR